MGDATIDDAALLDAFRSARRIASQRALWPSCYRDAEPNTCRYCGRRWQRWAGSELDGHAACVVTPDFKQQLVEVLRSSPEVTYAKVATALGVTVAVLRAWTSPTRSGR